MKHSLLGISVVLAAALTAACGGSDQNNKNSGGAGGTATGGSNTGASTTTGSSTGGTNTGTGTGTGAGGNTGGTGGATGGTGGATGGTGGATGGTGGATGGTGGTGGGQICGGKSGMTCDGTFYCDYTDDTCGVADGTGTCVSKPQGCPDVFAPVCACDGKVYNNKCEAEAAGADLQSLGGCPAPPGEFPCGSIFCAQKSQYCQIDVSDVGGIPNSFTCHDLPANCQSQGATCACLSDVACGNMCMQADGGFTVTCPGG